MARGSITSEMTDAALLGHKAGALMESMSAHAAALRGASFFGGFIAGAILRGHLLSDPERLKSIGFEWKSASAQFMEESLFFADCALCWLEEKSAMPKKWPPTQESARSKFIRGLTEPWKDDDWELAAIVFSSLARQEQNFGLKKEGGRQAKAALIEGFELDWATGSARAKRQKRPAGI